MPIVAESGPMIISDGQGGVAPTPRPGSTTPRPSRTPRPGTPIPVEIPVSASGFVTKHKEFISKIDSIGACFKREEFAELSDQEFQDHIAVAAVDRYVTQNKDTYCSMQAVSNLARSLKRAASDSDSEG